VTASVYWIHHPDHTDMFSQGYIGVSKNTERRWDEHFKKSDNKHFRFAINKYGWDNLIKKQILIAEEDYCFDIERKLRSKENTGWNIAIGGGKPPLRYGNKDRLGKSSWNKGVAWSDEMRQKLSQAHLGQVAWNKGIKSSKDAWNKGVSWSDEVKEKISVSKKGTKLSDETRAKMSLARKGKKPFKMTDEIRAKISASLKGHTPWNKKVKDI
jgi:hypothetical protein